MAENSTFSRLNFVRILVVLAIAVGYASTMPSGPESTEYFIHFGFEPSWLGIQVLFFFSGFLALHSLKRQQSAIKYLVSKVLRNGPMLAAFTLFAVAVIYPVFGVSSGNFIQDVAKLGGYFVKTVSCINPGQPLPGLLDDSKYMCLIQGAIWTFRWGLLAHIGAAISWRLGLFSKKPLLPIYAAGATLGYITLQSFYVQSGIEALTTPLIGARLVYPFLAGMAMYAYRDSLPKQTIVKTAWLAALGLFTMVNHKFLPWTPFIEVGLTGFWIYAAYNLAFSRTQALSWTENWPHLALGFYLANWPASQILLLVNPQLSPLGLIAMSIPLALSLAVLTYVAVHGPTTNLFRQKLGAKIAVKSA